MSPCRSDHIFTAIRSVWHMVSEDSVRLFAVPPSIPAPSVHGERKSAEALESLLAQMSSCRHRTDDPGEGEELLLLGAQKGLRLEEWDHALQQIRPVSH